MSDQIEIMIQDANNQSKEKLSMNYVLEQIEKLSSQTQHLDNVIQKIGEVTDYAGDLVVGQTKAQALADIIRYRETTNQQFLKLYEKMYDDLKPRNKTTDMMSEVLKFVSASGPFSDEKISVLNTLNEIVQSLQKC